MTQLEYDEERAAADAGGDTAFKFPTQEDLDRIPGAAKGGFSFNPKDLVPDIREIASRDYAEPEALHQFCDRMRATPIELPDGTRTDVHAMMIAPAQREAAADVLAAGKKDGREHALLLDADTGERVGNMQTGSAREIKVDLSEAKKQGRMVDVAHNHPSGNPTLSPADALFGTDPIVHDVLATGDQGVMKLRVLDKSEAMQREIKSWKARLEKAKKSGALDRERTNWLAWLAVQQLEGKIKLREELK